MVELLVVMFIMAVVVALIVGVSKYVMDSAAKKQTETAQEIVLQAIQEYRRVKNAVPPDDGDHETDVLMAELETCEQSAKIVEKLSKEVYPQRRGELRDGYDQPMRYYQDEAIGNEPLLLSAGPDREWGEGAGEAAQREDNIASDGSTVNP
jgi:type II secretory pathway pseudopilin PulG